MKRLSLLLSTSFALASPVFGQAVLLQLEGKAGQNLGFSVATGDFDGDGVRDVAAGSPEAAGLFPAAGLVSAWSSQGALKWTFDGVLAGGHLGRAMAVVGDVDGDGGDDLIAGAPDAAHGSPKSGAVYMRSGKTGALVFSWGPTLAGAHAGASVSAVGDVDGDGMVDVAIGAPGAAGGNGTVYIARAADGVIFDSILHFGEVGLGRALSAVGDIDGDGFDDILISSKTEVNQPEAGRVLVWSVFKGSALFQYDGTMFHEQLGSALVGPGDVNGDGVPDFVVGSLGANVPFTLAGRIDVRSGMDGSLIRSHSGSHGNMRLGEELADAGDVDGDGVHDLIAGVPYMNGDDPNLEFAEGSARLYSGSDGDILQVLPGHGFGELNGFAVAGAGDVDNDGKPDLVVATPFSGEGGADAGRVRIHSSANCGAISTYGAGCGGSGGVAPSLAGTGCAVSLKDIGVEIKGAIGGQTALLLIGVQPNNVPVSGACSLLMAPLVGPLPVPLFGPSSPGLGFTKLSAPLPFLDAPVDVYMQAATTDPGVPAGFAMTNGLVLHLVP